MRFIYLQDTHIKGVNPINRKGDYYKDIMTKINEVIGIAGEMDCDFLVHGGDLFDSSNVSNLMVDEFIDDVEQSGIEWKILPGNHDSIGHNWELSKGSSLAHIFRRSKLIEELIITNEANLATYEIETTVEGFKYYHNCEEDIKKNGLYAKEKFSDYKIAIIHALITEKPLMPGIMHIPIKEVKTDFDVIFVAHNHLAWSIIEQNGVKFVNVGALGRTGVDEADIVPTVALINSETKEIKLIKLKSAKLKGEAFNLSKVEKSKKFNNEIEHFIKSLESTKFQSLNIRGLIEILSKDNRIEEKVKKEVIKRIGDCENEL